ncbi:unnamed protein product [Lymnaea stagnalis]|uniref:Gamma-butyrobetaine hydroxylase-like N-terminal domain-containing protein n=1 Tax=Lymnaea stagnalis TaxID=6523 RepID=A0AAV2IBM8_LYMST
MLRYTPKVCIVTRVRKLLALAQDHNKITTRSLQRWGAVLLKDKGTRAPSVQQTANFDSIKRRGFYIDEVYQHVKHTGVRDLSLVDDGKNIQVTWEDQHISRFHAMWLRHNCQCETCLPQTSTVLVDFSKIDDDIRVTSARMEGEDVINLTWTGQARDTHHEGFILTKFLRHYCYSEAAERKRRTERAMNFDNDRVIPEVEFDDVMKNEEGLYKWLTALSDRGLCLVKSVPTVRGTIRQVAERIAPIQHTIYGDVSTKQ